MFCNSSHGLFSLIIIIMNYFRYVRSADNNSHSLQLSLSMKYSNSTHNYKCTAIFPTMMCISVWIWFSRFCFFIDMLNLQSRVLLFFAECSWVLFSYPFGLWLLSGCVRVRVYKLVVSTCSSVARFLTSKSGGNGNKTPHRKFIWFVDAQSNEMTEGYWQPEEGHSMPCTALVLAPHSHRPLRKIYGN